MCSWFPTLYCWRSTGWPISSRGTDAVANVVYLRYTWGVVIKNNYHCSPVGGGFGAWARSVFTWAIWRMCDSSLTGWMHVQKSSLFRRPSWCWFCGFGSAVDCLLLRGRNVDCQSRAFSAFCGDEFLRMAFVNETNNYLMVGEDKPSWTMQDFIIPTFFENHNKVNWI